MDDQTPTKTETNQGTLEGSEVPQSTETLDVQPKIPIVRQEASLTRLVTPEELDVYFDKTDEASDRILARAELEVQLPSVNRDDKSISIPSSLEGNEYSLFLSIATLCHLSAVNLYLYESKLLVNTKKDSQKFIDGFLVGTYSGKPCKLDRSKKDLELGRAFAYALKLRGEMIKLEKLDLLSKNNFYFGNNPEERVSNTPIVFGAKLKFIDIFEDPKFGSAMYSVLLYLFEQVGLSQFDEKDYHASFMRHTLRFDEVVARFYQPVKTTKRGKTVVTSYRKGKKPNPSPLLTKGEYNLLMKIAGPLWTDLDHFKTEWTNSVLSTTKSDSIIDRLRRLYKSRFEFLQKFGSLTTKRLQEVRAFKNNANLKKVDVTQQMLTDTLQKRANPGEQFLREAIKVFETNHWVWDEFEVTNEIQEGQLKNFIIREVMASYVEDQVLIIKVDRIDILPLEKDVIKCLSALKHLISRLREFSGRVGRCTVLYDVSILERRFVPAKIIMEHVMSGAAAMLHDYKPAFIEFLLERFFQIKTTSTEFFNFLKKILTACELCMKESTSDWKTDRDSLLRFSDSLTKVVKELTFSSNLYVQPK